MGRTRMRTITLRMSKMLSCRSGAVVVALALGLPGPVAAQEYQDEWLGHPVDDGTFATFLDFFAYDRQVSFDVSVIGSGESEGVRYEHFAFQSTPGVRVYANARYVSSAGGGTDRPSIILLHGGLPLGKDGGGMNRAATAFVRSGFNVLSLDMQYYGERKTDLLTTFTEQEKHDRLYNQPSTFLAWVAQTVKDVGRAYDFLVQEKGADPERIGLFGFSRGGQMALIIGGADARFAVVVTMSSGHFDRFENGHRAAACPANYIGRISPRPLLMVNGNFDSDYNKETSVLPLQRLAGEPFTPLWADIEHEMPPQEYWDALTQWVRENL